jgi:hypothetical protein
LTYTPNLEERVMRMLIGNYRLLRIAASALMFPLLVSCINSSAPKTSPPYWSQLQKNQGIDSCPKMEGVYVNSGQQLTGVSGRPCAREIGECESLINNLLFDARLTLLPHPTPRSSAHTIRIVQPSRGVIEVISFPGNEKKSLSMDAGDFTCDENGLRLSKKTAFVTIFISSMFSTELRTFRIEDDGSLIMKAEFNNVGHHTFFPITRDDETWVRWTRMAPETSSQ